MPESVENVYAIYGSSTELTVNFVTNGIEGLIPEGMLGINTGRLGFMTALEIDEFSKVGTLKSGNYQIKITNYLKNNKTISFNSYGISID